MQYSWLADCYEDLEATQSTLEKTDILADLFADAEPEELEVLAHLVMGRPFPAWKDLDIGIGSKLMVTAISRATGIQESRVEDAWREAGDLGDVAEQFVERKKQQTLATKELTPVSVQETMEEMAQISGDNSQDRKIGKIAELIGFATPREAKYIVRTIVGAMRVGVGEGLVRDAIIEAFFADVIPPDQFPQILEERGNRVAIDETLEDGVADYGLFEDFTDENDVIFLDTTELGLADLWRGEGYDIVVTEEPDQWADELEALVQHAYDVTTDFGLVAKTAATAGVAGLEEMEMELFRPVKVMLARKAETMDDAFDAVGNSTGEAVVEFKYDGMRVQIHKDGDEVKVFTRRLEDVTKQFPDIVSAVKETVDAEQCIIEGEAVAYDPDSGEKIAFQNLSKRIKRKYNIQEMVNEIPVTVYLFDALYIDGETLLDASLTERWNRLKEIVDGAEKDIELAHHLRTDDQDEAREFYQQALNQEQEGVMLKNGDATYTPGSRVGYMVKLKPVMETLDLVIVEADWGEGRRSDWLGSYTLACYDAETGEFETVGKMATGFTDEQLQEMTDRLEDKIIAQDGRHVELEPAVVVEAAYEEIQESPQYGSGYALRFPRLVQVREDLDPEDADALSKVEHLYENQS